MKIESLNKEEIFNQLEICKTQTEFLKHFGYKRNGSGYRFLQKIVKYYDINLDNYFNITNKRKYSKNVRYCKGCGKELEYEKRNNIFCSKSCSATYNNYKRVLSDETKLKISNTLLNQYRPISCIDLMKENIKQENTCKVCGKKFNGKSDFCSLECIDDEKLERWHNGENFIRGVSQVPDFIRRYLFKKYNNSCQVCGWSKENPYTNKIPLSIHHIDGDCTNNKEENLQLLCPNCHSLTENFGSLNKNSKRFHRKKVTKN